MLLPSLPSATSSPQTKSSQTQAPQGPLAEGAVLLVACLLPTLVTLIYFVWAGGTASSVQQTIYSVAKVVQFSLPVVWVGLVLREPLGWPTARGQGIGLGLLFGGAIFAAIWALYGLWGGMSLFEVAVGSIREKVVSMGLTTPGQFIALGVFYSLLHSLLEEYYWRWFVYGRMTCYLPSFAAIGLSAVAFAAHHVVVLWHFFAHAPALAFLLAALVGVGGGFWAWLYRRCGSLYAPWLSHLCIDAAIFSLGYHLVRPIWPS